MRRPWRRPCRRAPTCAANGRTTCSSRTGRSRGILVESAATGGQALDWLIAGIGINVASHPEIAGRPATSLQALGGAATAADLLPGLVKAVAERLADWQVHGFDAIRQRWLARAWRFGERVELVAGGDRVSGAFQDLDAGGGIVLEFADGARRSLGHGELMAHG